MAEFHVLSAGPDADPDIRVLRIAARDVLDALREGLSDFSVRPTHYAFAVLIYPVIGLLQFAWAAGWQVWSLIYPLASGFAILGPLALLGLYEISRGLERGERAPWHRAFGVVSSPALPSILALGAWLALLFAAWLATAQGLAAWLIPAGDSATARDFLSAVLFTRSGWWLIGIGHLAGFGFALAAFSTTVVGFPLLLDRDVGVRAAIVTCLRCVIGNPGPMALWAGLVAGLLVLGALPALTGLIVVLPVLGHATWRLYRKLVSPL